MSQAGIANLQSSQPHVPTTFVANSGTAVPAANVLNVLGTVVAASGVPLQTTGSGNTLTVVSQYASAAGASSASNAGLASFSTASFSVDANGFVTFTGGAGGITTINGDTGSVTGTTIKISGATTGLTTSGSGTTLSLTGILKLANGGTNANLTASNGGIFYSTASAGAILSGTATANRVLLSGASTTPAWSTSTYPATNSTNDLIYGTGSNTLGTLSISSIAGSSLQFDGNNILWSDPRNSTIIFDDFISGNAQSNYNWNAGTSNAGTVGQLTTIDTGHPGMVQLSTGTNTNGGAYTNIGPGTMKLSGGAITIIWVINVVSLSNATDTFTIITGMSDSNSASSLPNNAVAFLYSDSGSTPNWQFLCRSGSSGSATASSTAVTTGWHTLMININAGATSVSFSVDGVTLSNSPISSNIPTTNAMGLYNSILKSAGTSSKSNYYDMCYMYQKLTSAR
jgi:hypothetical protein